MDAEGRDRWRHASRADTVSATSMTVPTLRAWLRRLREEDLLAVVGRRVDPRFELAAVTRRLDGRRAVWFARVGDADVPVVAGVACTRSMLAAACGMTEARLVDRLLEAEARPRPCAVVPPSEAPVQERVVRDGIDLLRLLPVPVHHEKDGGHHVSAGLCVVRDPVTRVQNVSIHRLQVAGPDRFTALILPRHTDQLYRAAEARGEPLECAIVIGADVATILASQSHVPFGVSELEVASALHDEPLPVVRCRTVDVDVPAAAEIVIEGRILPRARLPEGPFGEFPRYYGPLSDKHVIDVTAITHRERPIFHDILPAGREHLLLGAVPREASLLRGLRRTFPAVRAVHMTPGGSCRFHAVVSMEKRQEGQARNVILATLANNFDIKHVWVVDADVDVFDAEAVEWALATRFQADRDVVLVGGAQGSRLDPSADEGVSAKLGFDCTVPVGAEPERYEVIRIPGAGAVDLDDYVDAEAELPEL
jgi:2,5-furandicarboxylate decarboxylase 1